MKYSLEEILSNITKYFRILSNIIKYYHCSFNEKLVCKNIPGSRWSLQIKYSLAETADNMQNLTQIQIALNLAISAEQNNGKAGAGGPNV